MKTRKLDRKNRILLAGSTASLVASIMTAGAQSAATNAPVKLPTVVVTGTTNSPSLTVPGVVQAEAAARLVPGGTDIIKAEDYKTGRASTLKDVLAWSPGVFIQERFGAEEARLSIRGSGLQRTFHGRGLKLMQDGVPLNLADGGFDMQAVEPLAVDYVEVLRGGNALRYGSTTLGGSVNFISPNGYTAPRLSLRAEGGSYGYVRGQVASGMVVGQADYYASVSHFSQDGFRDHARQSNQRVFANLGYKINETVENRTYYTYVITDSELPGSITKAQLDTTPSMANAGNVTGNQKRDFELHRIANKTTWQHEDNRVDLGIFWSHKDLFHPIFQVIDQNSNDFGVDLRYTRTADLFGRRNELTVGFAPTVGFVENVQFTNTGGGKGPMTLQNEQESENLDFYIENKHWVNDRLALVAGVQFSYANRNLNGLVASPTFRQDYLGVNPKVGAVYELTEGVQLFGNISRSMEPPSFSEMGNAGVPATFVPRSEQTAWTGELGTRGERGRFNWDVTGYYSILKNELLVLTLPGGGGTSTINAENTIHAGIELGAGYRIWEGISTGDSGSDADAITARVAYQWNNFHFKEDGVFQNNTIPGVPEHFTKFEVMYTHPCGFYFGPNVEWSAIKTPIDHANSFYADPYGIVGLKGGWRNDKWGVFVEARNLNDKRYAASTGVVLDAAGADAAQFLPGDGRAFYAGLEWKW